MSAADTLRKCVEAMKLIDRSDCKDETVWMAVVDAQADAEGVLRDGRDKVLLADEVIAALDAMHEGCKEQSWTGWQNGNGEEVGDRLERAVQAYKAAPVLRDGEKQEPVAWLRFRAAQSWSGSGNHDVEYNEWLEICHANEVGDDKLPAFPIYTHPAPSLQAVGAVPENTDSPTFMGEPVILSKANDGSRKRAECFLEIMVALNIAPGSDQWNKAAEATRAYIASPSPVGVGEEGETTSDYSAMRLRLIAEKLGLGKAIPEKNADLWACAFSVLGMIRREVEKLVAPQPAAAPSGDVERYNAVLDEVIALHEKYLSHNMLETTDYFMNSIRAMKKRVPVAAITATKE